MLFKKKAANRSTIGRKRVWLPVSALCGSALLYTWNDHASLPEGLSYQGPSRTVSDTEFLSDISWLDSQGNRHLQQSIFDEVLNMIAEARRLILIDMFLFNDWQGPISENHRAISGELTAALVAQKKAFPEIRIIVISDPINTVYGGTANRHFDQMSNAGIELVLTNLGGLNDSNPVYSFIWEWLIRPWGNRPADTLPNPFGAGRVSLRSYLSMLNFKANHRKVIVVDDSSESYSALVTSANPHDGSSAHRNIALKFDGPAAIDVITAENAVLDLSGHSVYNPVDSAVPLESSPQTIRVLTERRIKQAILDLLSRTGSGDSVDLLMFYLADREVVAALISAVSRGTMVRVILDVNHDAFGREKNGVPNLPVAQELVDHGVSVRWCLTAGEQCHAKMLLVGLNSDSESDRQWSMLQGSANFTRRNIDNFNLEANVLLTGDENTTALVAARQHFDLMWENRTNEIYTTDYEDFADDSWSKKWLYRVMEASGLSTF